MKKERKRPKIGYSSKLTSKNQATVPKEIRSRLKLRSGDQIIYELLKDGTVILRKKSPIDMEYLESLEETMNEWESEEDERAYRNL